MKLNTKLKAIFVAFLILSVVSCTNDKNDFKLEINNLELAQKWALQSVNIFDGKKDVELFIVDENGVLAKEEEVDVEVPVEGGEEGETRTEKQIQLVPLAEDEEPVLKGSGSLNYLVTSGGGSYVLDLSAAEPKVVKGEDGEEFLDLDGFLNNPIKDVLLGEEGTFSIGDINFYASSLLEGFDKSIRLGDFICDVTSVKTHDSPFRSSSIDTEGLSDEEIAELKKVTWSLEGNQLIFKTSSGVKTAEIIFVNESKLRFQIEADDFVDVYGKDALITQYGNVVEGVKYGIFGTETNPTQGAMVVEFAVVEE